MGLIGRVNRGRRRAFIESYDFAPALRDKLCERFGDERSVTPALEGLRTWFLTCLRADANLLGMPSRAVDVAWHEMILMTREYHAFCERAFGRYLHHSPEAVVPEPMEDALARTLDILDRHPPSASSTTARPGVPALFAVDAELGLEDGYAWAPDDLARLRRRRGRAGGGGFGLWAYSGVGDGGGGGGDGGGGCGGGGCGGGG